MERFERRAFDMVLGRNELEVRCWFEGSDEEGVYLEHEGFEMLLSRDTANEDVL